MRRRFRRMVCRVISVGCAVKREVPLTLRREEIMASVDTPADFMRIRVPRNEPFTGALPASMRAARRRRLRWLVSARLVDRKSTRLNSSHTVISYAVFCLKKKKKKKKAIRHH